MTSPPGRDQDEHLDPLAVALRDAISDSRTSGRRVTVVVPTPFAARRVGRLAGADERIAVITSDQLMWELGSPAAQARGERRASRAVDRAAITMAARHGGAWLADLVDLPGGAAAAHDAVGEMRRATADTIDALARRAGRVGDVARLTIDTGAALRAHGFADPVDVDSAAAHAAAGDGDGDGDGDEVGALVVLNAGPRSPAARRVLARLVDAAAPRQGPTPVTVRHVGGDGPTPPLTEVRTCSDADEEGRAALRAVMDGVDRGVALTDMAVFHPPGPAYARIVSQHLQVAGVDTAGPLCDGLTRTASGRGLLGLLDLAGSEWRRSQVMAWMASAPVAERPGGAPVPAASWDDLSARAGVAQGAAQWQARLRLHQGPIGDDRAPTAARLALFMAELVTRGAPPVGGWAAHARWSAALLDRYLAPHPAWPARQVDAARRVRAAVLGLGELDAFGPAPDLPAFRRAVRDALADAGSEPVAAPPRGEGVVVAPFAWAWGVRLDTAVLVGLGEAQSAMVSDPPGPWSHDERALDATGALRTEVNMRHELWAALGEAAGAGRDRRIATVARLDRRSGTSVTASPWLTGLMGTRTRQRATTSFASGVSSAATPVDRSELELRDTMRWTARHGDVAGAPLIRRSGRLVAAVAGIRGRADSAFTRFDGRLPPGSVGGFGADSPVSPTRLETYVACPRRFLFDRVLGVSRRPDPEHAWQIEPAARGTLVHAILEDYLRDVLAGAPRSLEQLRAIAETHFAEAEARGETGRRVLWEMERSAIRRDLTRFHREDEGLEPLAAELAFGTGEAGASPALAVTLPDGRTVTFKGRADRVDRVPSGTLVVSDYKTGAQRLLSDLVRDPVAGGRLLQLPVYALAAHARFGAVTAADADSSDDSEPVRARYWLLSQHRSAPCYRLSVTEPVLSRFRHVVDLIVAAIESGAFPGAPGGRAPDRRFSACRYCDYDQVCPSTRARQWTRKRGDDALAAWQALAGAEVPDGVSGLVSAGVLDEDSAVYSDTAGVGDVGNGDDEGGEEP